jgi:hypothetical protein
MLAGVVLVAAAWAAAPAARAAQPCNTTSADAAARSALLPYAERHAPKTYAGGIDKLDYQRGALLCRDLTGDGRREMVVRMNCCTGGAPSPWGIFTLDAAGAWRLTYARAADTVFRLTVSGHSVRAMMPAPYEGTCTRFVRYRVVTWNGKRYRSHVTARKRAPNTNTC